MAGVGLVPAIMDVAIGVDHVGSTSVPGLAAKPIIDVDIVVATEGDVAIVIERLDGIGYRWRGDLGVLGREAFAAPSHVDLPTHHLYVVVKDNRAHMDHWLLRDLLRSDRQARDGYSALKRQNVELAQGDMDVYLARKAGFVAGLLKRARGVRPTSDHLVRPSGVEPEGRRFSDSSPSFWGLQGPFGNIE